MFLFNENRNKFEYFSELVRWFLTIMIWTRIIATKSADSGNDFKASFNKKDYVIYINMCSWSIVYYKGNRKYCYHILIPPVRYL